MGKMTPVFEEVVVVLLVARLLVVVAHVEAGAGGPRACWIPASRKFWRSGMMRRTAVAERVAHTQAARREAACSGAGEQQVLVRRGLEEPVVGGAEDGAGLP